MAGSQGRNSQLAGHGRVRAGVQIRQLSQRFFAEPECRGQRTVRSLYTSFGQAIWGSRADAGRARGQRSSRSAITVEPRPRQRCCRYNPRS